MVLVLRNIQMQVAHKSGAIMSYGVDVVAELSV
jgi:hypothetical protein